MIAVQAQLIARAVSVDRDCAAALICTRWRRLYPFLFASLASQLSQEEMLRGYTLPDMDQSQLLSTQPRLALHLGDFESSYGTAR